jgi:hypothetical protein
MATKKPAKPKAPPDYNSKLYIGNEMAAFDRKDRGYFDSMTPDEQKTFSPFLMIRWGSSIDGPADLERYYITTLNANLNKNFFDISTAKHKKLQWLLATTVSPDMGKQRHQWIAAKKKDADNKSLKFLRQMYPDAKESDIRLMEKINTKEDLKELARQHGWDDRRIKAEL